MDDWESILWFATVNQAVSGLAALKVRTSDAKTLADALAEVKKVTATLSQALIPKFKITLADPLRDEESVEASPSHAEAWKKEAEG